MYQVLIIIVYLPERQALVAAYHSRGIVRRPEKPAPPRQIMNALFCNVVEQQHLFYSTVYQARPNVNTRFRPFVRATMTSVKLYAYTPARGPPTTHLCCHVDAAVSTVLQGAVRPVVLETTLVLVARRDFRLFAYPPPPAGRRVIRRAVLTIPEVVVAAQIASV